MKRIFSVVLLAVLGAMGPVAAAETASPPDVKLIPDSIIVTANRVGIAAAKSVWPVTVVGLAALQNEADLETVLDGRAGLDTRNYNGFGSLSTISNWGVFARHVLLLYNGRVVKDYSLGGFNLSDFSAGEIQRVEILKGPQSAFYGADAVGGVVNLITGNSLTDKVEVSAKRGTFGYGQYSLNLSRRVGQIGISGHAEFAESDNHRSNAGSERTVFSLRSDYLSDDGKHHLTISARCFDDSLGVPGPRPDADYIPVYGDAGSWSLYDHQKDENYSADFQYRVADNKGGSFQMDIFWEKKNLDYNSLYNYQSFYYTYDDPITPVDSQLNVDSVDVYTRSVYNKRSLGVSGRFMKDVRALQLAGGIDYLSGSIRATASDVGDAINIVGPLAPFAYTYETNNFWNGAQDQFDLWSNAIATTAFGPQLDLSGRLQFVSDRQMQPSYNLGLIVPLREWLTWKTGYAYAFRLPTIAEQFAEEIFIAGNRELNPETSRSLTGTLALSVPESRVSSRLTFFHQTVDSLIQYQYDGNSFHFVPQNVDCFKSTGVDLELNYRLIDELSLRWSGVVQKAEQTTDGGVDFVDAFYVPDMKWRADVSGEYSRFTCGFNVCYTSDRSIILGEDIKIIEQVYELGVSVSVAVTTGLSLNLAGHDLTDEARPDQFGFSITDGDYPSPGRRFVAGLRYSLP